MPLPKNRAGGSDPVSGRMRLPPPPIAESSGGGELRHSHGYARPISPASIGRVRIAAMAAEIRAHLVAQSAERFGDRAAVADCHGAFCVHRDEETVFVVVQDLAPAIRAINGSVDHLLHCSEAAREIPQGPRVVLVVVGIQKGGAEADHHLAALTTRYGVAFRYVTYQLGARSFWI